MVARTFVCTEHTVNTHKHTQMDERERERSNDAAHIHLDIYLSHSLILSAPHTLSQCGVLWSPSENSVLLSRVCV